MSRADAEEQTGLAAASSARSIATNSHASSCRELLLKLRTQFSDPDTSKDVACWRLPAATP
eukprot:scaffold1317_cov234-Pinguiococcus_pyrenoidosus.AAC.2